ncbi:GAF domain-containing protein [Bryobacter aggregatus]|uniref:GAF domain-containing protein n=1 Tax=Bryobacter aggregatus TaxID=360054 RepID=UPI0004E23532|nr:GAF domain-containing protein [Bryobacter aggregatus]
MAKQKERTVQFEERAELLDFLLEVAETTSATLDLDQVLDHVGDVIHRVIGFDVFAILLYSDRAKQLKVRYSIGHRDELVRTLTVKPGEGLVGAAAESRQPVNVGDVRADSRYLNALDAIRSEVAVPMLARGRLVGVIDLESTRLNAYGKREEALLSLIASRVASAVDNARLYRRVEQNHKTLKLLTQLTKEFSSILDLDILLQKIASGVRTLIHYDGFSVMLVDEAEQVLKNRFSLRFDQRKSADIPLSMGVTGAAVRARHTIRVADVAEDERYIETSAGIRSEVAVPLIVNDRVIGVMDVESDRVNFFTEEHSRTLGLLAPQVAASIENARLYEEVASRQLRMEQDLIAARRVQSLLLPQEDPGIHGLEIGMGMRPAREVTGDIYDVFEIEEKVALIAFGDSSGKGAAAALYGAMVSGFLRSMAYRRLSPAKMMKVLNDRLCERRVEGQYVTLMLVRWDADEKKLTFASAGGGLPLLMRDGKVTRLHLEGVPLGLLENREYDETVSIVKTGDLVGLFSDGFEDQANAEGVPFGQNGLKQSFQRYKQVAPGLIFEKVLSDLDEYRSAVSIHDDQSALILKVK